MNKSSRKRMLQTSTKGEQDYERLGGGGDLRGIVQEVEIRIYNQRVYALTKNPPRIWDT